MIHEDRPNHQGSNKLDNGIRNQMFEQNKKDKSKALLFDTNKQLHKD